MNITIIGLDHVTQWKDSTGKLKELLESLCNENHPDLIAEETSHSIPTTVGQRLAQTLNIPWINVDMDNYQRGETGVDFAVPCGPLFDSQGNLVGASEGYKPEVQKVRENYWFNQIARCHSEKVVFVCGAIHFDPFSELLERNGHLVRRIRAWEEEWYKASAGEFLIFNKAGERFSEFRFPKPQA